MAYFERDFRGLFNERLGIVGALDRFDEMLFVPRAAVCYRGDVVCKLDGREARTTFADGRKDQIAGQPCLADAFAVLGAVLNALRLGQLNAGLDAEPEHGAVFVEPADSELLAAGVEIYVARILERGSECQVSVFVVDVAVECVVEVFELPRAADDPVAVCESLFNSRYGDRGLRGRADGVGAAQRPVPERSALVFAQLRVFLAVGVQIIGRVAEHGQYFARVRVVDNERACGGNSVFVLR